MQGFENKENQVKVGHFLQSREWEEFQKSVGRETFRMGGILVSKLPLIFGKSYLYCAGVSDLENLRMFFAPRKGGTSSTPPSHGVNDSPLKSQKILADFLKDIVFLKLEPMLALRSIACPAKPWRSGGEGGVLSDVVPDEFRRSNKEIQPQKTIVLDLIKNEEELLSEMHEKTRYNIRLAERRGIKILLSEKYDVFWELMKKTSERDRFSPHAKEYYRKLLELPFVKLFVAEYQNKVVAANIILFFGKIAYYLHGASDYEYRKVMAPYLSHWETIKYAKEHGYKEYDLWGIDEGKWPGVTRFKRGFGGREIEYVGSYDYVFQSLWYKFYNFRNWLKSKV